MDFNRLRIKSLDEDDNLSGQYSSLRNSYNPTFNSDSEYSGSISVRDMIKHYDRNWKMDDSSAISPSSQRSSNMARRQVHHTLRSCKSSSFTGLRPYADSSSCSVDEKNGSVSCCKNCTACMCCQNRSRKSSVAINASYSNESVGNPNVYDDVIVVGKTKTATLPTVELKDSFGLAHPTLNARNVMEKNRLQSTDSIEEANCHPIETSYQSKTTITKTAGGVRIIIDIFFDQEQQCVNATDVLGSRVETDIPQSRILNEFQQQATAATASATAASATSRK